MRVKKLKLLSPLLVLALALSLMAGVVLPQTALANPADWYVSTMGSDTEGDGSPGNPWRTIQHAVSSPGVSNGDTIIVDAGTYIENVNVDKELTIRAAAGENVTVQAANSNDHVFRVAANNVNITGLTVTNATGSQKAGIYLGPLTEHCTIMNNTAEGNYLGIYLYNSSDNTLSGNTAADNDYGVYLSHSSGNTISGNTASGNDHHGIYLSESNGNTIEGNNTASGNEDCGISLRYSSNNTIEGNTASDSDRGIYLEHSSGNTIEGNNTASDNSYGIYLFSSSNNTLSGNIANENDYTGICLDESSNNTLSGNTASGNNQGIRLYNSSDNTLSGNTANGNNNHGIRLSYSSNNTLSGNIANENNNTGIYLEESSDNTISGNNTASDNSYYGIYLYESSNNTLSGNTANGNNNRGIWLDDSGNNTIEGNALSGNNHGIYLQFSSDNAISNNTASENYHGICLYGSTGNTISGNTASGNYFNGMWVFLSSDNLFTNNEISNNEHGVWIEGDNNQIIGNDISNNSGSEDSGIHFTADASGNVARFNNIVGNSPQGSDSYGVYNQNTTETVDATLNWWGDASGPSGVATGTGDAVSGNVTFEPWLGVSVAGVVAEDITGAQEGVEISGPTGSDTTLTVTTTNDVTVAVALYSGNPEEPLPDKALGKYIDIYASDPDVINWPVYVKMSYTQDEVAAAGIDESTLGIYYWDTSADEFHRCSDTDVDTDSNIIWANVTAAEAGGLAGTPFAPGGAAPGGLSIGVIAGIVIGAIAGAVLIFFAVRKWVWRS